jgi:hypothetical protein
VKIVKNERDPPLFTIQLSSGHYYLYRYEKLINKLLNVCNLYTPHNEVVGGYTGFTKLFTALVFFLQLKKIK